MTNTTDAGSGVCTQQIVESSGALRTRALVEAAFELASYVIENGIKSADGQPLAFTDIATIESTAAMLNILDVDRADKQSTITNDQWTAFEQAYYRLAIATVPVTAETLRNTRHAAPPSGIFCTVATMVLGYSPAERLTRRIWLVTFIAAGLVLYIQWRIDSLGMNHDVTSVKISTDLWQALQSL